MRKLTVVSVLALTVLVGAASAMAQGSGKTLESRKAAGAVTIDGDLKEFMTPAPAGNAIGILDTASATLESGAIDDDADFSAKFYSLYDDKNLYFGFAVKDDAIMGAAAEGNIWQNDTFEIWFDADNDDSESTETGSVHTDQHQIGVTIATNDEPGKTGHYVWRSQDNADLLDGVREAGKVVKDGWTMEVAIPIAALHGAFSKVKPGQVLAFNLSGVDNDSGDWNHLTWNGTQHNNPQGFGMLLIK